MEALPDPTSHSSIPHSYSTVQVVVSTEQLCLVPVSIRDPHCWHLLKGQPLLQGACGLNRKGLAADSPSQDRHSKPQPSTCSGPERYAQTYLASAASGKGKAMVKQATAKDEAARLGTSRCETTTRL